MRTSQITLALAVALILSVTGCQDRPGGFAVTDPSADPAFESDGFQRMVEVIGPTWPWPGFVERHGQPPADPSTPWLIPRFDDTGRDVWAVPGFGPWSWKQIEITSRGNWTGQYAWLTIGSDGFAQTLTEFSGRVYTGDDFERLGFSTGFALIHSYHLRAAERELASIRARGPVDADPAVEIKVLEERIGMLHKSLDVWRATELGLLEADDQGDDDDWCDVRPRISSADTRQTVDKATGDDSHARISASGDHSTDEKAIHSLGTIIQVRLDGFQIVMESGPGTGYDGSCQSTRSPTARAPSLSVSVDEPDFEHLCAGSWSAHRAQWVGKPDDRTTSNNPEGCEPLGDGNRIWDPIRH